ncbi:MAG TPA: DinB family protein [Acidimicrobiales bacterium]|nr:DinB family protein [Acidimicrobiales bacterium]
MARRSIGTPDECRATWSDIEKLWGEAVERARRLPEEARHERVDGEWSFVETLRHLVFATDAWVRRAVLEEVAPFHRLALPHSDYPAALHASIGVDVDATPSFDEVMAVRLDRMATVHGVVDALTDDELARMCTLSPSPDFPDERFTVGQCLWTVMNEERAHHGYATRDLARIESRSS